MKHENFLALDPGIRHTGYAYWSMLEPGQLPLASGVAQGGKQHWLYAFREQILWFRRMIDRYTIKRVFIESVEMWSKSLVSSTSATRGDLFKVAYLIGGFMSTADSLGINVTLCPTKKWKGQLTKDAVIGRIRRHYMAQIQTCPDFSNHEADAVGMGLYYMGEL